MCYGKERDKVKLRFDIAMLAGWRILNFQRLLPLQEILIFCVSKPHSVKFLLYNMTMPNLNFRKHCFHDVALLLTDIYPNSVYNSNSAPDNKFSQWVSNRHINICITGMWQCFFPAHLWRMNMLAGWGRHCFVTVSWH